MLAQEFYRRSLATLAEVDCARISHRSVYYLYQERTPQCAVTRRYVRYVAPDRIHATWLDCNPVAEPERTDLVQVGPTAYRRQSLLSDGAWEEIEPVLTSPDELSELLSGWLTLPSAVAGSFGGGFVTAFRVPAYLALRIDGHERPTVLLPVETQRHPRIYFPGDRPGSGPGPRLVPHNGALHRPSRLVDSGQLFIEGMTARPLRYLSTLVATIDDSTSVTIARTHIRFRYDGAAPISLPV